MENKTNGMAVASLICGIASCAFAFIFVWIGLVAGILAIVFSVKGRKVSEPGKTGMATAGLVLGIVGTSLSGILLLCALCVIGTVATAVGSINY